MRSPSIVVIDEDLEECAIVAEVLRIEGATVSLATKKEDGLRLLNGEPTDVVFADLQSLGSNGNSRVDEALRTHPGMRLVVLAGLPSLDSSVEALRRGACDYVTKPITAEKISAALGRAIASLRRLPLPASTGPVVNQASKTTGEIVAASRSMQDVLTLAARAVQKSVPILIQGEVGVGKEAMARWIHHRSEQRHREFISVNCSALRMEQLTEIWFGKADGGHESAGLLERAMGGTLFLRDVTALPLSFQDQLQTVIDQGWFKRQGEAETIPLNARFITADSQDIRKEVACRRFLGGLYYLLSVVPIHIPPLRDRKEDIQVLAEHFLLQSRRQYAVPLCAKGSCYSKEVLALLLNYSWPGNVRELKNVVKRSVLLADGEPIQLRDIDYMAQPKAPIESDGKLVIPLGGSLKTMNRLIIDAMIQQHRGNKSAAARALGLPRRTLYRMLQGPNAVECPS